MKTPVGDRPFRRAWLICPLLRSPHHSCHAPLGTTVTKDPRGSWSVCPRICTRRERGRGERQCNSRGGHTAWSPSVSFSLPLALCSAPFLDAGSGSLLAAHIRLKSTECVPRHLPPSGRLAKSASPTQIGPPSSAMGIGARPGHDWHRWPTLLALAQRAGRAAWDHRVQARSPLPTSVAAMRARRAARLSRSPTATHCWDHGACDCPGNDNENDNDTLREVRHPSMKASPHKQECRGHDPAKKNMLR